MVVGKANLTSKLMVNGKPNLSRKVIANVTNVNRKILRCFIISVWAVL